MKERDLTNKARAQVLLPARSFLMKKDPLTLTSCIGPLKLIGVFARLSWSDLRGDRCAIFSPDSTCTRNKSVSEVARSSSKNARHQFFASCFLADLLFFSCFRADSPADACEDTKKTRFGGSAHIYKQKEELFFLLHQKKVRTLFILSSWPLLQP